MDKTTCKYGHPVIIKERKYITKGGAEKIIKRKYCKTCNLNAVHDFRERFKAKSSINTTVQPEKHLQDATK